MEDDELARRSGGGDADAFRELLGRYQERLYSYLRHRVGPADSDDVFQEVCMKLWAGLARYEPRGRFPAWLFTLARRAMLDSLARRGRREPRAPASQDVEERGLSDPQPSPQAQAEAGETRRRIERALASLPAEQRDVFLLKEYGGLTFREIAVIHGCPLGTALARMRYALLKLRASLRDPA